MRRIYEEYFHIPEQGKGIMKEKVFFARLIVSIACMAVCMIAMGYNAYAFFSSNVESTANQLQASTYTVDIVGTKVSTEAGTFTGDTEVKHKYTLPKGTYDFVITKAESATASTGYCRIDVGEGNEVQKFYSQQIGGVYDENKQEIRTRTIRIVVDRETVIQFVDCWGTYIGNMPDAPDESKVALITSQEKMLSVSSGAASAVAWQEPTTGAATNDINLATVDDTPETSTEESNNTQSTPGSETNNSGSSETEQSGEKEQGGETESTDNADSTQTTSETNVISE